MIKVKVIKLKSQPKRVARSMFGVGAVLGLALALHMLPIGGSKADNEIMPSSYIHEEMVDEINTLTICDPNDGTACITVMDRNLGAETNDIASTGSYGYHYQWGNNHGFLSCYDEWCTDFPGGESTTDIQVDASSYGPGNWFNSGIWFNGEDDWSNPSNNNLWGGGEDEINNYVYPIENYDERQGPCVTGYHVPSASEWSKLLTYWVANYTGIGNELQIGSSNNLIFLTSEENPLDILYSSNSFEDIEIAINQIMYDLKLPSGGGRSMFGVYNDNVLRSSSPNSDSFARMFLYSDNGELKGIYTNGDTSRASAFPVRCFKNTPVIIEGDEGGEDEEVSLVQMTSDSISSLVWFNEGTVDIQWSEGTTGGWFLSTSDVSGNVENIPSNCEAEEDCVPVEEAGTGIQVELTTGMNNKYFCAFGLSGDEKQVVCFDSVVLIDDENPTITDVSVVTGDFGDGGYVSFDLVGSDGISGISGFILSVDGDYFDTNGAVFLDQGTHYRTVVAEDKAGNRSEESTGSFEIAGDDSGGTNPGHGSAPRYVQFGDRVVYGSWTTNGRVDIEWLRGATGGRWFSTIGDASSVEIPSEGHYTGVTNGETSIQLTQSMNGKYICAFGQTGDTSPQVICSDHYVRIDNQHPEIELLSPSNGTEFYLGDGVSLSWSGSDGVSGISGYELTIRNSSSSVIMTRTLSSEYYNYTVSETGNLTWTVKACDFAMNCTEISRNFVALYTGTAVQGSGFYLIRPASGDVINLGSSIQFSWNPGNVNRGYNYEILKVGDNEWSISGSTDNTYVQINGSRFSEGTYSWSVKDIASDTVKSVPAFYVVENGDTPDLKVDQFEFDEKRNAEVDELYTSNEIRIRGLTNGRYVPVSLKDNKGSLRINGEFVGSRGYVRNNDRVYIELKASREHNTTVSATLLVGLGQNLVTGEFKVTTSENGAGGWDNSSLTPLQKLWGIVFVDSLVEMYQSNESKLAVFLSTFMQVLEDKVNEYDSLATEAEEDGDEDLAAEYRLYKNALAFLYTIVEYRYNNIAVEEREVYIAPNGRQYLVEYDYDRMAYTSPDFAKPKYFPTWEQFTNHIDKNNPKSGNWGVAGNVITTHNGKTYTIYEVNGKWTSSNFATAKYFDSKEDIINHILANNPASSWDHDIDTNFIQVTYTAPNGRTYRIFKTSSDGNNPNMYSSYDFINAKYFTTLEAAKKYIRENNQK